MATDVERLVVSLEASITKYTKALQKASGDADSSAGKIERRFRTMNDKISRESAASASAIQGQTGNIAAQFQDIGVQLAGGQSPLLIALQQGTQLGAVLGTAGGGVIGAVKALGAGFAAVVSPVNLATIGLIALGGAAIQYFSSDDEADVLTEALKRQDDVIRGLKEAYGEAAKGVDDYLKKSRLAADEAAKRQEEQLVAAVARDAEAAGALLADRLNFAGAIGAEVDEGIRTLQAALDGLNASVAAGEPDLVTFTARLQEISVSSEYAEDVRDLAREVLDLLSAAGNSGDALAQLRGHIGGVADEAVAARTQVSALAKAISALGNISLPSLDDEAKALEAYTEGLKNATTAGERASVEASYIAAQQRIQAANTPKPGVKPTRDLRSDLIAGVDPEPKSGGGGRRGGSGGGSKRADTSYTDAVKQIQERTQAYLMEAQAIAAFGGNVDQARTYVDLLMDAQAQGIPITDALKGSISELAGQYAVAGDAAQQAAEAQREMERAAEEFADLGRDMLGGFIQDLRSGKSAAEALANALDKVADKLLNSALDGLFGGAGGGLGGIFGSLFGGGYKPTNIGGLYLAGGGQVRGPGTSTSDSIPARLSNGEFVVNAKASRKHMDLLQAINSGTLPGFAAGGPVGMIRPATALRPAPSGGASDGRIAHITLNLAGAKGNQEVARIARAQVVEGLRQYDASLPSRIRDKQTKSYL